MNINLNNLSDIARENNFWCAEVNILLWDYTESIIIVVEVGILPEELFKFFNIVKDNVTVF